MASLRKILMIVWDIWRAKRGGTDAIQARQQMRLRDMIEYARQNSPYYKQLYQHLPAHIEHLSDLPVVTKRDLMSHFNDWVTDSRVRRDDIDTFIADPSLIGIPYLGRYADLADIRHNWIAGIFLHDPGAFAVYLHSLTSAARLFFVDDAEAVLESELRVAGVAPLFLRQVGILLVMSLRRLPISLRMVRA